MGGIDGLVFTAGIGERSAEIRARVLRRLHWLGFSIDEAANQAGGPLLTRADSRAAGLCDPDRRGDRHRAPHAGANIRGAEPAARRDRVNDPEGRQIQMATTYKDMLAAAHAAVPKVTAAEAAALVDKAGALIVDVRDGTEVAASGKAKGAVAVPRGSLESR